MITNFLFLATLNFVNGPLEIQTLVITHLITLLPVGGVLLAADYSQLELRMIAHLSQDAKLISILNGGGDVFKTIAAQWKGVEVKHVTATQRQQAKQVGLGCYGSYSKSAWL